MLNQSLLFNHCGDVGNGITNLIYDTLFSPSDLFIGNKIAAGFYIKQIDTNIYRMLKETVCSNLFIGKMLLAWPIIPSVSLILK